MEALIILILILIAVFTVRDYCRKIREGCCGQGGKSEKRLHVADRDPAHYPYRISVSIDGMVCGQCAVHLENALNRLEGVWASVSLETQNADIRMKQPLDEVVLRKTIQKAGYFPLSIIRKTPNV